MKLHIAVVQFMPKKGDYLFNIGQAGDVFEQIETDGLPADVVVFPETALTGYFLQGGVREVARTRESVFEDLQAEYSRRLGKSAPERDIAVGFYELYNGNYYNSCLYTTLGGASPGIRHVYRKFFLPTYGVFDEERFVTRGHVIETFPTRFGQAAMLICEDLWHSITATIAALKGAKILYVGVASPARGFSGERMDNLNKWRSLITATADEHGLFVVSANLVGFEGGKGFIGGSAVVGPSGSIRAEGPVGKEAIVLTTLDTDDIAIARANAPTLADLESCLGDILLEMDSLKRRME
ncbi:MAG: beta-ureidopropionase [Armatimonadetes bacterium]|nr:beta-ureidopropionase [Armatimonadota bacterium]